jgi:hypothetical protein
VKEIAKKSRGHARLQNKLAGNRGKKEVPIKIGRKIRRRDVMTPKKVYEIERSGQVQKIKLALRRLQASKKPHKILKVPNKDLSMAVKIRGKRNITVSNLGGTKHR